MADDEADALAGADALERSLRAEGHPWRVEARGTLALLVGGSEAAATAADPAVRRRLVQSARQAGFTHVALEIDDAPGPLHAPLPGDQPPR